MVLGVLWPGHSGEESAFRTLIDTYGSVNQLAQELVVVHDHEIDRVAGIVVPGKPLSLPIQLLLDAKTRFRAGTQAALLGWVRRSDPK